MVDPPTPAPGQVESPESVAAREGRLLEVREEAPEVRGARVVGTPRPVLGRVTDVDVPVDATP